jgi:hypothetical protein
MILKFARKEEDASLAKGSVMKLKKPIFPMDSKI